VKIAPSAVGVCLNNENTPRRFMNPTTVEGAMPTNTCASPYNYRQFMVQSSGRRRFVSGLLAAFGRRASGLAIRKVARPYCAPKKDPSQHPTRRRGPRARFRLEGSCCRKSDPAASPARFGRTPFVYWGILRPLSLCTHQPIFCRRRGSATCFHATAFFGTIYFHRCGPIRAF